MLAVAAAVQHVRLRLGVGRRGVRRAKRFETIVPADKADRCPTDKADRWFRASGEPVVALADPPGVGPEAADARANNSIRKVRSLFKNLTT